MKNSSFTPKSFSEAGLLPRFSLFKKIGILLCATLFTFHISLAQGVWTWVKGDTTSGGTPVFGTQGVPSPANTPPGMYEGAEWTDLQGNFWLFGGLTNGFSSYGDLWQFDVTTNNWTWMKGTGAANDPGNYGTMGIPAASNQPPCKSWGIATWVDLNGNLWLYGGQNHGGYNDLWEYNIASNTWTWMQGSSSQGATPVYGTLGVPSAGNTPGSRWECSATWVDSTGNLWLFGGYNNGTYNDLWMYNIASNQWTWMSGSSSGGQTGVYGSLGVPDPSNVPGSRFAYCSWKDSKGKFWLFGGGTSVNFNTFNDMWKYDPSVNEWTWMSGSNQTADAGNYGATCVSSVSYYPAGHLENRARWKDDCGKFWLYGGGGNGGTFGTLYSDLWNFDPVSLKWTLSNGSSASYVNPFYGTMGVASTSNLPGGRAGTVAWKGNNGNLYLFGGTVDGWIKPCNDLWMYTPDPTCPADSFFSFHLGNDTSYCGAFSRVLSTNNSNTLWSTGVTAPQITVNAAGKYWASVNSSCGIASDTISISTVPNPTAGIITSSRDTICANSGVKSILSVTGSSGNLQWQSSPDGIHFSNLPGDTSSTYTTPPALAQTTYYRMVVNNGRGIDSSNIKPVHVVPEPVANFTFTINGPQVTFNSDSSSKDVTLYSWNFGDNSPLNTQPDPTHTFSNPDTFYVCLTVYNGSNCSYTLCKDVDVVTGINNVSAQSVIQLYPNPAGNSINLMVEGLEGNYQLKIYNVLGQIVGGIYESSLHDKQIITLPLVNFAEGAYELILSNGNQYYIKRFVHQE